MRLRGRGKRSSRRGHVDIPAWVVPKRWQHRRKRLSKCPWDYLYQEIIVRKRHGQTGWESCCVTGGAEVELLLELEEVVSTGKDRVVLKLKAEKTRWSTDENTASKDVEEETRREHPGGMLKQRLPTAPYQHSWIGCEQGTTFHVSLHFKAWPPIVGDC